MSVCDTMSCKLGSTGPREKVAWGSSPVITVPAAMGPRFQVGHRRLTCSHACNETAREHTHTLSPSCGLFTWDHDTSTHSECRFSGRKGRGRVCGVGMESREQWGSTATRLKFFGLIEAHHKIAKFYSSTLYIDHWHVFCNGRPRPPRRTFPRLRLSFPAPTSEPSLSSLFNNHRTGLNIQDGLRW